MSEIRQLVEVVKQADHYRHAQLLAMWPELARAIAAVIEGMTDQDAPPEWWATRDDDTESAPEGGRYGLFQTPPAQVRDFTPRVLSPEAARDFLATRYFGEVGSDRT